MNYKAADDGIWFNLARSGGRSMSPPRARRACPRDRSSTRSGDPSAPSLRSRRARSRGRSRTPGLSELARGTIRRHLRVLDELAKRARSRGRSTSASRAQRARSRDRSGTTGPIFPFCLARARLRRRDGRARARRRRTAGPLGSARRERSERKNRNPAPGLSPPYETMTYQHPAGISLNSVLLHTLSFTL